ncbi:MAG: IS256 family transposase [Fervidicoccaceae archaeon]
MDEDILEKAKEQALTKVGKKYFGEELQGEQKLALKYFFEEMLNELMRAERDVFLEKDTRNKGNGYYQRDLVTGSLRLNLDVPRDRRGKFRPQVLPAHYRRVDEEYTDLLMSLVVNGYSESQVIRSLRELGLPYSEAELNRIKEELEGKLNDFKQRELPSEALALFIDGYHTEIKDKAKVRKACVYTVLGIDLQGRKDIYGFYTFFGAESRASWLKIFNDLIERGLKKIALIVSDDFSGLTEAIKTLFPLTDHQLCFLHLQRNVRRNMGKEDARLFNRELENIRLSQDYEEAQKRFEQLCQHYQSKYPTFIKNIQSKVVHYVCFLKYPEEIRRYLYTTNAVENFNSRIEQIRFRLGGYFQSVEILEINLLLQTERLKQGKWKNPLPVLKSRAYEIQQLFNLKFYEQTQNY